MIKDKKNILLLFIALGLITFIQYINFDIFYKPLLKGLFIAILGLYLIFLSVVDETKLIQSKKRHYFYLILLFFLALISRVIYFENQLSFNGDNCWYILNAWHWIKNSVIMGEYSGVSANDLSRAGIVIFLLPVIKLFGLNFIALKMPVLIISLLIPLGAYYCFKPYIKGKFLFQLLLLITLNSQLIHFSTLVFLYTIFKSVSK